MRNVNPTVIKLASAPDVASRFPNSQGIRRLRSKRAAMIPDEIDVFHRVQNQHEKDVAKGWRGTLLAVSVAGALVPTAGSIGLACHGDMSHEDKVSCYTNVVGLAASLLGAGIAVHGVWEFCGERAHLNAKIKAFDDTMLRRLSTVKANHIRPTIISDFFRQYKDLSKQDQRAVVADLETKL